MAFAVTTERFAITIALMVLDPWQPGKNVRTSKAASPEERKARRTEAPFLRRLGAMLAGKISPRRVADR
jgi:hypothetical protein